MNNSEIKQILQNIYDRNQWLRFLVFVANQNNNRLVDTLHVQDLSNQLSTNKSYPVQELLKIGIYKTTDNQTIPIYEITLKEKIRIERNRVGVNLFIKNVVLAQQGLKAALCIFKHSNVEENKEWRFSFVSKFSASQFFSDVSSKETNSKRYTYIFGSNEEHRTSIQNFINLKNSSFKIQDFFNAFSVEKVSKEFFDGYKDLYTTLVDEITAVTGNYISVFNKKDKAVRDFSKRLLGRIIFLYFLQKKQWLGSSNLKYDDGDLDFLNTLFIQSNCEEDGSDYYLYKLTELFFDTLNKERPNDDFVLPNGSKVKVPYLNGGLFDDNVEPKGYELLIIPNWVFKRLFEFLAAYNFTIDESSPEDHTVAVDPEMLGHIFENLLEDNKDKGAFYTPKEIVHYMCQESLIEYLATNLSKTYTVYKPLGEEQIEIFGNDSKVGQLSMIESIGSKALNRLEIELLVRKKDITQLTQKQLSKIDSLLDSVKVCDPAIGSGAFPMGILQEIFAIKELIAFQNETEFNPEKVKSDIIQNSVYGVDIEQGAVDIARLRFWLSLVVEADMPHPLPNLDYKIVTGNSLVTKFGLSEEQQFVIDIDWDKDDTKEGMFGQQLILDKIDLLTKLSEKQKKYFSTEAKSKSKLQQEIRHLVLQVLEKQLSLTIKTKGFEGKVNGKKLTKKQAEGLVQTQIWQKCLNDIKKLKRNNNDFFFFDWKLNFAEILNPYLAKNIGKLGFDILIANPPYGASLEEKSVIRKLYPNSSFGETESYKFFFDMSITIIKNDGALNFITSNSFLSKENFKDLRKLILSSSKNLKIIDLGDDVFLNVVLPTAITSFNVKHISKLTEKHSYLIADNSRKKAFEKVQIINYQKIPVADITMPQFVRTKALTINVDCFPLIDIYEQVMGVKVYQVGKGKPKQTSYEKENDLFVDKVKKTEHHLKFIDSGIKKYKYKDNNKWIKYGEWLAEPRKPRFFNQDKIVIREIINPTIFATYLTGTSVVKNTNAVIIMRNENYTLKYLLALLNSNYINYYIKSNSPKSKNKAFPSFSSRLIKAIPIPKIKVDIQRLFIRMAEYLLIVSKRNDTSTYSFLLQVVDGMVYELYLPLILHEHKRSFIQHLGHLPDIQESMTSEQQMEIITKVYNRLSHPNHPLSINLYYMDTIPEIAVIEGKSENHEN